MRAYIVEKQAIADNLQSLKQRAADAPVWAVLKGNGYGLGLLPMAQLCRENGITRFAVTELTDAELLRKSGFSQEEILLLQPTADPETAKRIIELGVIATVSSQDDAEILNGVAAAMHTVSEAHIKVDTGMGRYGFLPEELKKMIPVYAFMDGIAVSGIYTHLSCTFCNKKFTLRQIERFNAVVKAITDAGFESGVPHILNSVGLLRFPEYRSGGVRIGSAMLGRVPVKGSWGLKRVGVCQSEVIELRWLPKGSTCGYGAGWKAKRPTRIAVIPVGYYHGFGCEMGNDLFRFRDQLRRIASGLFGILFPKRFEVQIGKSRCRVLGHIGMLHTVVDVTDVQCELHDAAYLQINPLLLRGMDVIFK